MIFATGVHSEVYTQRCALRGVVLKFGVLKKNKSTLQEFFEIYRLEMTYSSQSCRNWFLKPMFVRFYKNLQGSKVQIFGF